MAALNSSGGKLEIAARQLGVSSSSLATDIYYHKIRLPLSSQTKTKLGTKRLAAIHEALRIGKQKKEICERYGLSEWSILRIQLDYPELSISHHEAVLFERKTRHRDTLCAFLASSPGKSRQVFYSQHSGSYDWLREHDWEWLEANLPRPDFKARGRGLRKPRKDWPQIDQAAALTIKHIVRNEHSKAGRPVRLTKSRLLSDVGARSALDRAKGNHYVLALAEAEHSAETPDHFVRRTIRWALQQYVSLHTAISTNLLRRVARLPPILLEEHRSYVIEIADELGLSFDARCALAPHHQ